MKKLILLVIVLLLTGCIYAVGEENDGFMCRLDDASLLIALDDGIWKVGEDGNNMQKISSDRAAMLQLYDGKVYYLANQYDMDDFGDMHVVSQVPVSMNPDGSEYQVIQDARHVGYVYDFISESYDTLLIDAYVGYKDFTVYNGEIFFLSNTNQGGEYVCTADWDMEGDETYSATGYYESGIALFKMDINGENLQPLTGVIGNSIASMAVKDDRIYLAGGYADTVYAYNFVNYSILSLNGEVLSSFENAYIEPDFPYKNDLGEFYHITQAVIPDGECILVSLSDSEGDFVASHLIRLYPDGKEELLAIEQNYVQSVLKDSTLYFMGSASDTVFYDDTINYDDSYGIYRKDLFESGSGVRIMPLDYDAYSYGCRIAAIGEYVYCLNSAYELYRVNVKTGEFSRFL